MTWMPESRVKLDGGSETSISQGINQGEKLPQMNPLDFRWVGIFLSEVTSDSKIKGTYAGGQVLWQRACQAGVNVCCCQSWLLLLYRICVQKVSMDWVSVNQSCFWSTVLGEEWWEWQPDVVLNIVNLHTVYHICKLWEYSTANPKTWDRDRNQDFHRPEFLKLLVNYFFKVYILVMLGCVNPEVISKRVILSRNVLKYIQTFQECMCRWFPKELVNIDIWWISEQRKLPRAGIHFYHTKTSWEIYLTSACIHVQPCKVTM